MTLWRRLGGEAEGKRSVSRTRGGGERTGERDGRTDREEKRTGRREHGREGGREGRGMKER